MMDTFFKFNQAFMATIQKAVTMAKTIVENGFTYMVFHVWYFKNEIMEHLYDMYSIEQSITIPYNMCSNLQCRRFNSALHHLLKTLSKQQSWPLHLLLLVSAYNVTPQINRLPAV